MGEAIASLYTLGGPALFVLIVIAGWATALMVKEALALTFKLDRPIGSMPVLGALVAIAPLVGLLGTVEGLVSIFTSNEDPQALSAGIARALTTTKVGLIIAIPALLAREGLLRWRQRHWARLAMTEAGS